MQPVDPLISHSLSLSSSDRAFLCHAKHVIPFNHCPEAADSFSLEADRDTTVYFIYYLERGSISGGGVRPA